MNPDQGKHFLVLEWWIKWSSLDEWAVTAETINGRIQKLTRRTPLLDIESSLIGFRTG